MASVGSVLQEASARRLGEWAAGFDELVDELRNRRPGDGRVIALPGKLGESREDPMGGIGVEEAILRA